ncbi:MULTISPECIES: hypothetical protein [unclassified Pseudactinotalea]|uniref:hypothetical protein n=1 Tax=Micrococcales TaxID=85006 RepID=UPI003C7B371D
MTQVPSGDSHDLAVLRRWENAGGDWEVVARGETSVRIALCRCDGGEEVERITSTDPALLRYIVEASH